MARSNGAGHTSRATTAALFQIYRIHSRSNIVRARAHTRIIYYEAQPGTTDTMYVCTGYRN